MTEDITLLELLKILSTCSGDEVIDLVSKFQNGALTIEGIAADEVVNE